MSISTNSDDYMTTIAATAATTITINNLDKTDNLSKVSINRAIASKSISRHTPSEALRE
jgi:hypothetical protein